MGQTIIAERTQTNVPIGIDVTRDGGIVGLTIVFRLYRGDAITEFLDFDDGVFKAAGHVTPTQILGEIGLGRYELAGGFDLSAITLPTATEHLIAQYEITAGGESGNDSDLIDLVDEHKSIADKATVDTISSSISALNNLSEAGVQSAMDSQGYTVARAALLNNLDAAVSTVIVAIASLEDISEADVQSAMDSQGYTTIRAVLLDNLDAAISLVRDHAKAANAQTQPLP